MKVSQDVSLALVNQAGGQLATLAAIVLDGGLLDKGYPVALQRAATEARLAPKSDKTWSNYVSTARAVLIRVADLFPEREPAGFELANRLAVELRKGGYFTQVDDVARWAKGKPAAAAARLAKSKTTPAATATPAAPAAAATPAPAPAPAAAATPAPAPAVPAATATPAAPAPATLLIGFLSDGSLEVYAEATDADLQECIDRIRQALAERQTVTV